jgi:predicted ester cyclase
MAAVETLRRIYDRINGGDLAGLDDAIEPDYVEHADGTVGIEAFRTRIAAFRQGFPDLHVAIEQIVEQGDLVASRTTITGTNTGELMGMPPTGRSVRLVAVDMARLSPNGRASERWGGLDMYALLQQLGLLGAPSEPAMSSD